MKIRFTVLSAFLLFATVIGARVRAADAGAPTITNTPLTVTTTIGASFSYTITATNSPTSYFASGLPAGLTIDRSTGVISGVPALGGSTNVLIGATNAAGTGVATLRITVESTDIPVVNNEPLFAGGTVNTPFSFVVTSSGSGTNYSATNLPSGLSISSTTGLISGTPTSPGVTLVPVTVANGVGTSTSILTISIGAVGTPVPQYLPAPEITGATTATARAGTAFTYQVAATNSPTTYTATGLPAGLSLNTSTGAITGAPTTAGAYPVVLTASNATGTGASTLTITVAPAPIVPPAITGPSSAAATVGTTFPALQIAATGLPTVYTATGLPPGLTLNSSTGVITGTPTTAGTYLATVTAANSAGSSTAQVTITVAPAPVAPTITSATSVTARAGEPFPTYVITAAGLPTSFSAVGLPAGLTLNPATGAITGTPTAPGTFFVTIGASNNIGANTATLTLVVTGSRIVNFSARALSGPGDQTLVMGFVVTGNGKSLLARGIGPGLTPYGVTNVIADPMLTLLNSANTTVASNDDWQTTAIGQASAADIAAAATRVGAFALPAGSRDSALITTLNSGPYTTSMARTNATTGVALTEIYDLDVAGDARLINVSARMNVSAGEGTLIAGLAIAGNAPKTVLVRGVGPTLTRFGVTGVLADPQITVYSGTTPVATNDNWETGTTSAAQIAATSAQVGAFALNAGSRDAALLVTLQPGSYTVQITGVGSTTGVALIEIYDTQ
jgi:hypothetical protein